MIDPKILEAMRDTIVCCGLDVKRAKKEFSDFLRKTFGSENSLATYIGDFDIKGCAELKSGFPRASWFMDGLKQTLVLKSECSVEKLALLFNDENSGLAMLAVMVSQLVASEKRHEVTLIEKIKEALKKSMDDHREACLAQWLEDYDYEAYGEYDHHRGLPYYLYKSTVGQEAEKVLRDLQ